MGFFCYELERGVAKAPPLSSDVSHKTTSYYRARYLKYGAIIFSYCNIFSLIYVLPHFISLHQFFLSTSFSQLYLNICLHVCQGQVLSCYLHLFSFVIFAPLSHTLTSTVFIIYLVYTFDP